MPEAVLAIFGAWVLASLIAGTVFVTVRSRLKKRRIGLAIQQAQVQIASSAPPGRPAS